MNRGFLRTARATLVENVATILMVLVFFALFAFFLTRLFVPGTSLQQMVRKGAVDHAAPTLDADRTAMLDVGGGKEAWRRPSGASRS